MVNKKEVELFGKKVFLTERNVSDSIELQSFIQEIDETELANPKTALFANSIMLGHALKSNYTNSFLFKFIRLFNKTYIPKKYTAVYLYNNLSSSNLTSLVETVLELEGNKKKE